MAKEKLYRKICFPYTAVVKVPYVAASTSKYLGEMGGGQEKILGGQKVKNCMQRVQKINIRLSFLC